MSRRRLRGRRGSALVLVLLMTLAVAALAVAAIFMSSSAGLLSRFYDREREYRLAAESALEMARARLTFDTALVVPDTGMTQLAAGLVVPRADGSTPANVAVNVYAATTGDTTGRGLPHVTLIAAAYDDGGTRHVRRMDLQRESFSRYALFVDSFPSGSTFGPGTVLGRVHANDVWRSGTSAATAGVYLDTVTATGGFSGTATYADSSSAGPLIQYPRDSTYAWMTTLASAANLSFAPVSGNGFGWVRGSRLEFVSFDADGNGTVDAGEGFARVFDLAAGADTSRLRVGLDPNQWFGFYYARAWNDPVVQSQCGAFYWRDNRWQFFAVATHRAAWARNVIQRTGSSNFPSIGNGTMNTMDDYDHGAVHEILTQSTARCFPAGSPYLLTTERMTNSAGVVTGTAADTLPWGVVTPAGGWPLSAPLGYGGSDTTFTSRSLTCSISTGGTSGRCDAGTLATLGSWRAFAGSPVTGVATTIRQSEELPYLWPYAAPYNGASRGVMRATGGPLLVSGSFRGELTLVADDDVVIVESLTHEKSPTDMFLAPCTNRLGIVAVGDILVADNALVRPRRIYRTGPSSFTRQFGGERDVRIHANLMSLTGTVGVENPSTAATVSSAALSCPHDASANTAGGCLRLVGGAAMQRYTPLWNGTNTGMRYAGAADPCQTTGNRPPFFPLTNRYRVSRVIELAPSQARNPARIRSLLMRLKGATL